MTVIDKVATILLLERNEKLKMRKQYEKELAELPKGTFETQKYGRTERHYIHYYSGDEKRKRTIYIKKEDAPFLQRQYERSKFLAKTLRELRKDLEVIERMLRIANKRITQKGIGELPKDEDPNRATPPNKSSKAMVAHEIIPPQAPMK